MSPKLVSQHAQLALQKGDLALAEKLYLKLLDQDHHSLEALNGLFSLCVRSANPKRAQIYLERLCKIDASNVQYFQPLANLYSQAKQWQQAANCYARFLSVNDSPGDADTYCNYAYSLKLAGQYEQAIENYQLALDCKVSQPEEVFTNMSVIYSEHLRLESKAKEVLELALKAAPSYTPAMFNLATVYEEEGERELAATLYKGIIELQPENYVALARLVEVTRVSDSQSPLVKRMQAVLASPSADDFSRSSTHFALGSVFDRHSEYGQAFTHYSAANELDRAANRPYKRAEHERLVDDNIRFFTKSWFANIEPISEAEPIFICGMFRSGSTLLEQVLSSHSELVAGGERDFFYAIGYPYC